MKKTKNFDEFLIERLRDPERALAYLNTVLEDCKDGSDESQELLLETLKAIALAQGGFAQLSKKSNLGRESLYKTLSKRGNPKLSTLTALASALGFDLRFSLVAKR